MELCQPQTSTNCSHGTIGTLHKRNCIFTLYNRKDATLREVLTTLRNTASHVVEYRHPLARFSFRTVYAAPGNKGSFSQKDIGMVYSRDILGEPGSLNNAAPRLQQDTEPLSRGLNEREDRTLEFLKFIPGDFLLVAVLLPKNVTVPQELLIKGSGMPSAQAANGWRATGAGATSGKGDSGWGRGLGPGTNRGGGGHWRGDSNAPTGRARGGGRGGDFGRDRDGDRHDSRIPPPRRNDSPPRGGRGGRGRSRSRSRSRSLPRKRRYD